MNHGICARGQRFNLFRFFQAATVLPALAVVLAYGSESTLPDLTRPREAQSRRESSSATDLNSNGDSRVIKAGQTLVLDGLEQDPDGAIGE